MRSLIFTALFLLSFRLAAQRVSDTCIWAKPTADSAMRVWYGDYLFDHYFRFSPAHSFVKVDNGNSLKWRKKLHGDTIRSIRLAYQFIFPGSDPHFRHYYGVDLNSKGIIPYTNPHYPGKCTLVASEPVNKLAIDSLLHPLKKCGVSIYRSNPFDTIFRAKYDSTHVYLHVEFQERKRSGGGKLIELFRHGIVVDGCTGEFIRRTEWYYNLTGKW